MSINKLKNVWLSDDTTNLDGTYNKVSLLNYGKTELQKDTIINTKLAINKNIDSNNDYKLDVSGNINYTGSLYQNNALFTSGITQAFADGRYGQLAVANTFTEQNTFNNGILPCRTGSTSDIQLAGNNQLQFRASTSANNISIGALSLQGSTSTPANNTGSRNIAISHNVLQNLQNGSDNCFIGFQSGQNSSSSINQSLAIGNYSMQNASVSNCVVLGYKSAKI